MHLQWFITSVMLFILGVTLIAGTPNNTLENMPAPYAIALLSLLFGSFAMGMITGLLMIWSF